jgi:hypothetical protein
MVQILVHDTSAASGHTYTRFDTNALLVVCEKLSPLLQPCAKDIGVIDLPRERV